MRKLLFYCSLIAFTHAFGQKTVIDASTYDYWKTLSYAKISNDGAYISYEINPQKGDGYLYIYNVSTGHTDSISRGYVASFSENSRFLVFKIKPGIDTLRQCELKKLDKKKWPKDSLGILLLDQDSLIKIPDIKYYELSDESDWMVIAHNKNMKRPVKKRKLCKRKYDRNDSYKSTGVQMSVFHPDQSELQNYRDVKRYAISDNGRYVAFTTHKKVKCDSITLHMLDTESNKKVTYPKTYTSISKLSFDHQNSKLGFVYSTDSTKHKSFGLQLIKVEDLENILNLDPRNSVTPEGKDISYYEDLMFTRDGNRLFFGVDDLSKKEPKDTLTEDEKVKVDVWHYQDKRLQPQQLLELKDDIKAADIYVYDFLQNKVFFIAGDTLDINLDEDQMGDYMLARSSQPYMHTYNWEVPRKADYYRINLKSGESELLLEAQVFNVKLSPKGQYLSYFEEGHHRLMNLSTDTLSCMTCAHETVEWEVDINGQPRLAGPYDIIGWAEDETSVYLQSEFDVWEYDIPNNELRSISGQMGKEQNIRISALQWSDDSTYVDFNNTFFKGFDENTKGTHLYKYESHGDHWDMMEMGYFDADVFDLKRSKNKKQYMLRKMTFTEYPEIYTFNGDLELLDRVSVTNPQQSKYYWGYVEHVSWKSYEGIELEGLLYKPENVDPTRKSPMIVYYYELYSDKLHQYYTPRPTRAALIYSVAEYLSAGYYVFVPDIRYTPGHPAKSAYDCIMSGTDYILKNYPRIDSTRMGLQGQSWGGYQTAQMITMTSRYSAAMAGAPVSNMFSAYGGIRWGSGYNRQFQYERTQSRIGYTIWEKPELYFENSPLFHIPNITTPLLIMHNDGDGAVPWYQGIEMFTAMKRLNKRVWMLNYNDDEHNISRYANKVDLSIRMRQFFDHYLMDKEMPEWMEDGIPAIEKGKKLGY